MAGDWLKVELELPDKPEISYMAGILNMPPDEVVGRLIRAWAWFNKHTEDGHAFGVTYVTLDRIVGRDGFAEAMCLAGWLEQDEKTLIMPKFERHTSESAKKRALARDRKVTQRSRSERDKNVTREEKRREEKKEHNTNARNARFVLPDWIPQESWEGWIKSRKTKATDRAKSLAVAKLAELRQEGSDPGAVLDQSTLRGWTGLFPVKAEVSTRMESDA